MKNKLDNMKYVKLFEEYTAGDEADLVQHDSSRWPKLAAVIEGIWDGDVSFIEATGGGYTEPFSEEELDVMEQTVEDNGDFYGESGVPFPEENEEYANLVDTDRGAGLIQKMIDAVG